MCDLFIIYRERVRIGRSVDFSKSESSSFPAIFLRCSDLCQNQYFRPILIRIWNRTSAAKPRLLGFVRTCWYELLKSIEGVDGSNWWKCGAGDAYGHEPPKHLGRPFPLYSVLRMKEEKDGSRSVSRVGDDEDRSDKPVEADADPGTLMMTMRGEVSFQLVRQLYKQPYDEIFGDFVEGGDGKGGEGGRKRRGSVTNGFDSEEVIARICFALHCDTRRIKYRSIRLDVYSLWKTSIVEGKKLKPGRREVFGAVWRKVYESETSGRDSKVPFDVFNLPVRVLCKGKHMFVV